MRHSYTDTSPPSYARVARMSGAELLRQIDLSQAEAGQIPIRSLAWVEIELRLDGQKKLGNVLDIYPRMG